jgi:nucleotide-binding universal stress UspA family protein
MEEALVTADQATEVRRIVVGVDGSETSRHALHWAAHEAEAHQAELHVVHAWDVAAVGAGVGIAPGRRAAAAPEGQHEAAEQFVNQIVEEELGADAPTAIRKSIARGGAASVLLEASRGAELLVVGSRGLGGFRGLLLGSVSSKMAHHASCPVVIVRPAAPRDDS